MRIGFFPGCSAEGTALEYAQSVEYVAEHLGIELVELEDWSCCGATAGHCTDERISLALPARNIAIAERMGLPITVCCAACYGRLRNAEHVLGNDPEKRAEIAAILEMPLAIKSQTRHFLELLAHDFGLEKIKQHVVKPLKGLKVACYYGCYLVRPPEITHFDDPENPTLLDRFMETLGATAIDWPAKVDCCAGSLAFDRVDMAKTMLEYIMQSAIDAGANSIVAACPLCQANLDTRTPMKRQKALPILYFSELLALALGHPATTKWWKRHIFRPNALLKSLDLI